MKQITATINQEQYKTTLQTATNTIIADEPVEAGGHGLGFAPGELLASSLGACTAITLKMYAERKGWHLEEAKVVVTFEWDKEALKSVMTRKITFIGNLDEAQKERLLVIANSCPIHKVLSNPIEITTSLE